MFLFDMNQEGEGSVNKEPVQALRPDSTGSFTVMKGKDGKLSIYLHGSKKIITSNDLGFEINSVHCIWLKSGEKVFEIQEDRDTLEETVYFDRNGLVGRPGIDFIDNHLFEENIHKESIVDRSVVLLVNHDIESMEQ